MQKNRDIYLAGLVSPDVLYVIEKDPLNPIFLDLQSTNVLEIRYDFFDFSEWESLSSRVRKIAPNAMQIGTIRLKRDGGTFSDSSANDRMQLWELILKTKEIPEWLDLEQDCLYSYETLNKLTQERGSKILISQHNFMRIPTMNELKDFARDVERFKARGLKIAAMSNCDSDCDRLYEFSKKYSANFDLFAAFGMGEFGKISRIWSLKEGANLTYGSIGSSFAPGQLEVSLMKKSIDNLKIIASKFELSAFLSKF